MSSISQVSSQSWKLRRSITYRKVLSADTVFAMKIGNLRFHFTDRILNGDGNRSVSRSRKLIRPTELTAVSSS